MFEERIPNEIGDGGVGLGRWLHPRQSVTGKFLVATLLTGAVTLAVGLVAIWQLTTAIATTAAHADLIYRGGILAITVVVGTQLAGAVVLRQSIVGGLRTLDRHTIEILEKGTHAPEFSTNRADEIGQISWAVAELQAELADQVHALESLNRELTSVATTQSQTLAACSRGDLTQRMETETGTPQYDTLAMRFNEMMDQIEAMVAEVRSFSRIVTTAADDAETQAGHVTTAAKGITESTQSISSEVDRQHERVDSTADAIDELADSIDEIATQAETVADRSREAARETAAGEEAAGDALEELTTIRERTEDSVERMEALADSVDEIGAILELITKITDRTEQLAVNARVRTSGDGSTDGTDRLIDRIRELADDTDEAATEIETRLEEIETQTGLALEESRATQTAVEEGTETIETALGSFETISAAVGATTEDAARIESATDVQSQRVEELVDAANDLQAIGKRTARETTEVANAADGQQETVASIATSLQQLTALADELDEHLDAFTVRTAELDETLPRVER